MGDLISPASSSLDREARLELARVNAELSAVRELLERAQTICADYRETLRLLKHRRTCLYGLAAWTDEGSSGSAESHSPSGRTHMCKNSDQHPEETLDVQEEPRPQPCLPTHQDALASFKRLLDAISKQNRRRVMQDVMCVEMWLRNAAHVLGLLTLPPDVPDAQGAVEAARALVGARK